jgi:hypothetical protein
MKSVGILEKKATEAAAEMRQSLWHWRVWRCRSMQLCSFSASNKRCARQVQGTDIWNVKGSDDVVSHSELLGLCTFSSVRISESQKARTAVTLPSGRCIWTEGQRKLSLYKNI